MACSIHRVTTFTKPYTKNALKFSGINIKIILSTPSVLGNAALLVRVSWLFFSKWYFREFSLCIINVSSKGIYIKRQGGAQRPVLRVHEPKKTGARSALGEKPKPTSMK
jgi:hypothetical protein